MRNAHDEAVPITHDEAEQIALAYIDVALGNPEKPGRRVQHRIPADPRTDTDIRLMAYIKQQRAAAARVDWIPFDADDPIHRLATSESVQFVTYNGATVGYRQEDGCWYDQLCIGADGTPNEDYSDEQVTHWAPLLEAPELPKAGTE